MITKLPQNAVILRTTTASGAMPSTETIIKEQKMGHRTVRQPNLIYSYATSPQVSGFKDAFIDELTMYE
jgi:hypothetical protein